MGFIDKFVVGMKLDDQGDDEYEEIDEEEDSKIKKASFRETMEEKPEPKPQPVRQTPARNFTKKTTNLSGNEVCVIKPKEARESREIIDTLLADRIVLLNLEGLNYDIARRIIDFTSGASYAIDGNFQQISESMFMITPKTVNISGDFQDFIPQDNE